MIKPNNLATVLFMVASCATAVTAHAAGDASSKAEARQMVEETSPQGHYQSLRREANAAYREALAECKKMRGADRTACSKEARSNLQSDLAEAKKALSSGQ